jgi:hypothetical protein
MADRVLAYRHQENGPVGLALTGAAYSMANELGIGEIKPDVDAMTEIALCVGAEMRDGKLPPMLVVARAMPSGPSLRRDTELPTHQGQGLSAMYHFAHDIGSESTLSTNRDQLVRAARSFGATALTEVSIFSWRQSTQEHVRAFAAGLVLGDARKPLDLPPAPSAIEGVVGFFKKGLTSDNPQLVRRHRVDQNSNLPSPFVFKNRTGTVIDLAAR